jgi:AcrR family transcriptional regulator
VDRIAGRAEVNKAMIYYHIGDKQALYTRVLKEVFGNTAGRMTSAMAEASTPEEKIQAYIRTISRTLRENPSMPRIMIREMASGGNLLPPEVVQDLATIIGLVESAITQGHQEGVFTEIDPVVLHLMVIGGIGYYRASEGLRRHFAPRMKIIPGRDGGAGKGAEIDADDTGIIHEVEKIVLNALRAVPREAVP